MKKPKSPKQTFMEGLKAARLRLTGKRGHYVTPEELGRDVGVSGQTIRNYESGESEPTLEMIEKLGQVFGIDPGWPPFAAQMPPETSDLPVVDETAYPPPKELRKPAKRRKRGNG